MHVDDVGPVSGLGQARSDGTGTGQRERQRRRQHAKQVDQGDEPPSSHSSRSGKADDHLDVNSFDFSMSRLANIAANLKPAKPEL
jgi:hypothetical protein